MENKKILAEGLKSKSIKIVICERDSELGSQVGRSLRLLGFSNIQVVDSAQKAIDAMDIRSNKASWFISGLMESEKQNALQLYTIFLKMKEFQKIVWSLYINQTDTFCISKAFELGVLSCHQKQFDVDSWSEEFKVVIDSMQAFDFDVRQTSASQLAPLLKFINDFRGLLDLCSSLVRLYPTEAKYFLQLAEAQFLVSNTEAAIDSLIHAKALDPKIKDEVEQLFELYLRPFEIEKVKQTTPAQLLGIKNCIILDTDEEYQKLVFKAILDLGVPNVILCEQGEEAWKEITRLSELDLFIQEWVPETFEGPGLLQRFRNEFRYDVPIIMLVNEDDDDDDPLFKEMGVNKVVKKMMEVQDLKILIITSLREERFATDKNILLRKIFENLAIGKISAAFEITKELTWMNILPPEDRMHLKAMFHYHDKNYEIAKNFAEDAIRLGGDNLLLYNLIGMCLLGMREYKRAYACLTHIYSLSPYHIGRLVAIADALIELHQTDKAAEIIDNAGRIDSRSLQVIEAKIKLRFQQREYIKARNLVEELQQPTELVNKLVHRAKILAEAETVEPAKELLTTLLDMIPEAFPNEKSFILFELGLCCAMHEELDSAIEFLQESVTNKDSPIFPDANLLLSKVNVANQTESKNWRVMLDHKFSIKHSIHKNQDNEKGTPIKTGTKTRFLEEEDGQKAPEKFDQCCSSLFIANPERDDETKIKKLIGKSIDFARRN